MAAGMSVWVWLATLGSTTWAIGVAVGLTIALGQLAAADCIACRLLWPLLCVLLKAQPDLW